LLTLLTEVARQARTSRQADASCSRAQAQSWWRSDRIQRRTSRIASISAADPQENGEKEEEDEPTDKDGAPTAAAQDDLPAARLLGGEMRGGIVGYG
jgi:hypothetical protein